MKLIFTLLAVLALAGCATNIATPRPATSEHLVSRAGGFALQVDAKRAVKSCRYSLTLSVRRSETPLYLRTRFENPADPAAPLVVDTDVSPGTSEVRLASPEVRGLKPSKSYKVETLVFDSSERSRQIGQHTQYLKSQFHIP